MNKKQNDKNSIQIDSAQTCQRGMDLMKNNEVLNIRCLQILLSF